MIVVSTLRASSKSNRARAVAQVLDGYAVTFVRQAGGAHLRAPVSVAVAVQQRLTQQAQVGFYFFGHGVNPPGAGFVAEDGRAAVDSANVALLSGRVVGGTCCHGDQIGAYAHAAGFSMFGYVGTLRVPIAGPHIQDMEPAALAGPLALSVGKNSQAAAVAASSAYAGVSQLVFQRSGPGDKLASLVIGANATIARAWP